MTPVRNAVQLRFDYESLEPDTRAYVLERTEQIHNLARMTAAAIVQIGQYLTEVKERLKHGQFLQWIELEFAWHERQAQRFMGVFDRVKCDKLSDLQIDVSALYLIAAPSTPEPVRTEVIRRAEEGEKITHESVAVLRKRYEETGELPDSAAELIAMAIDAKREMQELPPLPTPAKARAIARATGKHTLDNAGVYQPPATEEQIEQGRADWDQCWTLCEFLKWQRCKALPAADLVPLLHRNRTGIRIEEIDAAIEWLTQVKENL